MEMSTAKLIALIKSISGGGGGGGSDSAFVANVVYGESDTHLDKTAGEISAAIDAGKKVYVKYDGSYDSPEYGYIDYRLESLKVYHYHNNTGSEEEQYAYWEFTFDSGAYNAPSLTDYPVLVD